jgi:hypothetical protein
MSWAALRSVGKGKSLIAMGPIEEQVEAELACACQRVCTPYFADA